MDIEQSSCEQSYSKTFCKEAIEFCNDSRDICNYSANFCKYSLFINSGLYFLYTLMVMRHYGAFQNLEMTIYDLIWNVLRMYGLINIKFKKYVRNPIDSFGKQVSTKFKNYIRDTPYPYIIVRDGEEIMRFKQINGLNTYCMITGNFSDDLIHYRVDESISYTKIKDFINLNCYNDDPNFIKKSSIEFIACNISLKLKNEDNFIKKEIALDNFMLIGNKILGKSFVMWYCNKYLGIDARLIERYRIEIIDQDVDQIVIDENDFIEIDDNEYLIHKKKHLCDKDEDTPVNELDKIIEETDNYGDENDGDDECSSVNNNKNESDNESDNESENESECESDNSDDSQSLLKKKKTI